MQRVKIVNKLQRRNDLGKYIDLNLEKYRNAPRAPTQSEMCEKLLLIFLAASTEVEEGKGAGVE